MAWEPGRVRALRWRLGQDEWTLLRPQAPANVYWSARRYSSGHLSPNKKRNETTKWFSVGSQEAYWNKRAGTMRRPVALSFDIYSLSR
jgi:hypothetical protein